MVVLQHTGHIEVLNSSLGNYSTKEHHFEYSAMDARVGLAVMNFKKNMVLVNADGTPIFHLHSNRHSGKRLRCVRKKKTLEWEEVAIGTVLSNYENKIKPQKQSIRSLRMPTVEEKKDRRRLKLDLIGKFQSRFPQLRN